MNNTVNPATTSYSVEDFLCRPQASFIENRRRAQGFCLPNNHPRRLGFLSVFPGEEAIEEFEKRFRKNYSTIFFAGNSRGVPLGKYKRNGLIFAKQLSTEPKYNYCGARVVARDDTRFLGDAYVYMMAGNAFLERVKVVSAARQEGIANSLVQQVEEVAREFGSRQLLINSPNKFPIVRDWCERRGLEPYALSYKRR